jgi:nucleotide-binding universal stress UspA family protein
VLPYVRLIAQNFNSDVRLLSVLDGNPSDTYKNQIQQYLNGVALGLGEEGIRAEGLVTGSGPARTIVRVSQDDRTDLIMLATHGRGGFDRFMLGSVADRVIQNMSCPVFLVPITGA